MRGARARPGRIGSRDDGGALAEVLVVAGVVAVLTGLAVPVVADVQEGSRARHAAGYVAAKFRAARQQAAATGLQTAVVFDLVGGRWSLRTCRDGNGNGVRRAELADGTDPCGSLREVPADLFPGVEVAVDPGLRGPSGEPGSADPVRLGTADLLSCSPLGTCTAGTVFLRASAGHYAIRVAGVTGRTRVLRHDGSSWREP